MVEGVVNANFSTAVNFNTLRCCLVLFIDFNVEIITYIKLDFETYIG